MSILQSAKRLSRQDVSKFTKLYERRYGEKLDCLDIRYDECVNNKVHCSAQLCNPDGVETTLIWNYSERAGNVSISSAYTDWAPHVHAQMIRAAREMQSANKSKIVAADEDRLSSAPLVDEWEEGADEAAFNDTLDDLSDKIDDLQDSVDEVEEDDPAIEQDNNISNHYIAECNRCKGVFISAVIESDQDVTSISGVCPLCGKETEQTLRWIIKSIDDI